jgi:predicted transcriptional regulator
MEDKQRFVRDTLSHFDSLEDVATFATTMLFSAVPTDKVALAVIKGDILRSVSTIGRRVFMDLSLDRPSINARAVRTRQTQLVNDTRKDSDYFPGDGADAHTMLSELCVPLVHEGTVLGTINLENRQPGRFSEEDKRVAEAFAAEIAGAVHRVMGHRRTKGRLQLCQMERTRTALDMYRDILRTVDGGEIVMNKILNRTAIQWMPGKQLIEDLVQKGYLERRRTTAKRHAYFITDEGQKALETYEGIAEYLGKQPPRPQE